MLMVMGLAANLDWWPEKLLTLLEKHHSLILFDNRGAGRTGSSKRCYSIGQFAEDTIALMDALDIQQTCVFGVSMGGMIAQEMALRHPKRVSRLILGCTTCGSEHGRQFSPKGLLHAFLYSFRIPPNLNRWLISLTLSRYKLNVPEYHDFIRRIKIAPISEIDKWKQFYAVKRFQSYSRLMNISCPVLVMTGTRDFLIPHHNSDILAKQIPQAHLVKFPNASHAFIGDEPESVFRTIQNFIKV